MFREIILPIFRSTRLCVTVCGIMHPRCCRPTAGNTVGALYHSILVDCFRNVMAHEQKPDFVFRRNGRVHLNRQGRQFSRLLAAEVCASVVVMLDTPCSEVVWRVLATHSIRQFPLHFPSRTWPCAVTFQLDSNLSSFHQYNLNLSGSVTIYAVSIRDSFPYSVFFLSI